MTANHGLLTDLFFHDLADYQVYVLTSRRPHAMCLCGWAGPHRFTTASARVDAWIHATQHGHLPATPLILRPSSQ